MPWGFSGSGRALLEVRTTARPFGDGVSRVRLFGKGCADATARPFEEGLLVFGRGGRRICVDESARLFEEAL